MKNIIFLIIVLFITSLAAAQTDKFTVKVDGLGCPFCAYGLEKKFKELKIAKGIKIDIETGMMTFTADASHALTAQKIDNQVDKAGYTAKEIKIERANGKVETTTGTLASTKKDTESKTFKVYGNCTMCESRIEKAVKSLNGVSSADWSTESKMLTVKFDANKVSLDAIHKKIAAVGHDTDRMKATANVYEKLPGCCHYDRPGSN